MPGCPESSASLIKIMILDPFDSLLLDIGFAKKSVSPTRNARFARNAAVPASWKFATVSSETPVFEPPKRVFWGPLLGPDFGLPAEGRGGTFCSASVLQK